LIKPAQRRLIKPLMADPARLGDDDDGEPVERRVRDPVDRAGQPGTPGDEHRAGRTGQVGVRGGHDRGRGFRVGEHEPQAGRCGGAYHVQVRAAAGNAEHHPGARPGQRGYHRRCATGRWRLLTVVDHRELPSGRPRLLV
jgi:hypothetical protein